MNLPDDLAQLPAAVSRRESGDGKTPTGSRAVRSITAFWREAGKAKVAHSDVYAVKLAVGFGPHITQVAGDLLVTVGVHAGHG